MTETNADNPTLGIIAFLFIVAVVTAVANAAGVNNPVLADAKPQAVKTPSVVAVTNEAGRVSYKYVRGTPDPSKVMTEDERKEMARRMKEWRETEQAQGHHGKDLADRMRFHASQIRAEILGRRKGVK